MTARALIELPPFCGARKPGEDEPILIKRGESGYWEWPWVFPPEEYNTERGITSAQVEAMLIGSMFGWDVPGADPLNHKL